MNNHFIALPIRESLKEKIGSTLTALMKKYAGLRIVKPELYHLTLKFLGKINEDEARNELKQLDFNEKAFTCRGIDFFYYDKRKEHPKVVFLKYTSEEGKEYHLTLARIREKESISTPAEEIKKGLGSVNFENFSFTSDKIALMHSYFDDGELEYETIASKSLK